MTVYCDEPFVVQPARPVAEIITLSNTTKMDEEKQQRVTVSFQGQDTDMLIHIWREQVDWVHVYAMSESQDLVNAVEAGIKAFERAADN